jgi:peptide/nickel transport system permease protein
MLLVVTLFLVTILVFFAMRLLPGDPIRMLISSRQMNYSQEQLDLLRHQAGLDKPLIVQYGNWISQIVRGELGTSILSHRPVWNEIKLRVPRTLYIGFWAFLLGIILGIPIGIVSAVRRAKWQDTVVTTLSNIGITVPSFWLGIIFIYVFAARLNILPAFGYTSPLDDFWMSTKQVILPVFCLAIFPLAANARQTRTAMLEVMRQDYIRTAWSKGLTERGVIIRHALKNGLIPVITLVGISVSHILGGSVVIETVFAVPGMGRLAVDSVFSQDYPYVQAIVLLISIVVMLTNLLVDLAYGWLDPRIRYE